MRATLFPVIVILLISAGTVHAQRRPTRAGWQADYDTARALAKKTGKPLMVVFRCEP